jgi:hypothetical protein
MGKVYLHVSITWVPNSLLLYIYIGFDLNQILIFMGSFGTYAYNLFFFFFQSIF